MYYNIEDETIHIQHKKNNYNRTFILFYYLLAAYIYTYTHTLDNINRSLVSDVSVALLSHIIIIIIIIIIS